MKDKHLQDNTPTEEEIKLVAAQLRKPEGEWGVKTGLRMNEGNERMNRNALRVLNPVAGDYILEIGMGNGHFVSEIMEIDPAIRYVGCDYSDIMVEEANRINAAFVLSGRAAFVHGDVEKMPFADHTFNKIFTVNTLYFWENPANVLTELKRVLTPNGQLMIGFRPKHIMAQYPMTNYGFTLYDIAELAALLQHNQLKVDLVDELMEPPQDMWGTEMKRESVVVVCSTPGG
ncbi:MAG: class I SAM-dependent methyltransferase [Saprospiraceae bacterium]